MSLELFMWPTPNGWKISVMIEELREAGHALPDLKVTMVELSKGEHFTQSYAAINPNQKIPTLVHNGFPIMESCAIIQYLGETFPSPLLPKRDYWTVVQWLYWQAANLGPVFGNKLSYTRYITASDEAKSHPLERFNKEALRLVAVLDGQLAHHSYICGAEFTAADVAVFPWVRAYKWAKIDIEKWPRVVDWVERCRARPGVDRGVGYGVPEEEKHRFSLARRQNYRERGAMIADNERLRTDT